MKAEDSRIQRMRELAVEALEDTKGKDIIAMDTRALTSLFDCMIVVTGDSNRQVKALANHAREALKQAGFDIVGLEGDQYGEWVLLDAGSLIVHVMLPAVRDYYNIEQLWGGQKPVFQPVRPWQAAVPVADQ